ncbi:MAG: alginate export family protein [Candidatus Omnitrophica bacterium]|nr:alginate export family protein [Candidatus Omnitrophota bacterium]
MKRMLTILLAVSMIALVAMPAFAEVQNIKVNGGVKITGITREGFINRGPAGSTTGYPEADSRDWYNTVTTLGVAADLTDNVSATMVLGNERDWGLATATTTTTGDATAVTVFSSYITMEEMLYSALTVKAGRMPLAIADKLIVGDGTGNINSLNSGNLSAQTEFDAIVGILDYDPLTVILGTVKVSDEAQSASDDVDLYLVDGIYKFEDDMNTVLDAYFGTAHYSSPGAATLTGPGANSTRTADVNVLAAVLTMEPAERVTAKFGIGYQFGDYQKTATASRGLDAMALDLGVNYAIDNEYAPVVGLKYVYRSGDDQATGANADYTGWLGLYEQQINGAIFDPNTNISAFALTATAVPADRLTIGLEYWMFTLDESLKTATTQCSTSDEAGSEIDLTASYAYTEDVKIGLGLGWFFPGDYYKSGFDETAMQALVQVAVKF